MRETKRIKAEAFHRAVCVHGSISKAWKAVDAKRDPPFESGLSWTMARQHYDAAINALRLKDVRTDARSLAHSPAAKLTDSVRSEVIHEIPAIENGVVIAFGDCHWTTLKQPRSLAHEALITLTRHLKPGFLFCVGDALNMGTVSRHPPLMWSDTKQPKVVDEIAAGQTYMREIREAAGDPDCYWIRGNHDDRFDKYLAAHAAAFEGMGAFSLQDQFPDWRMTWRLDVGEQLSVVHRWHAGIHAAYNNAMKSGRTIISGDTHALQVRPLNKWGSRSWGIECGMLGDPNWPCFNYRLGIEGQWQPGFAVLTFRDGVMATPEVVEVRDGAAWFRGEPIAGRVRVKAGRG